MLSTIDTYQTFADRTWGEFSGRTHYYLKKRKDVVYGMSSCFRNGRVLWEGKLGSGSKKQFFSVQQWLTIFLSQLF